MNKWFPLIFSLLFLTACGGGTESSDGAKDEDSDKDTIINSQDNCPNVPNTNQLDSNGNGVGDACEGSQTLREKALKKISEYAKSKGTSSPPTVKDYIDAQVVGVTSESLSKINQRVSQLTESDVDTVSEIQEILKELNISAPSADFDGDGIKDSVDNCPSHANPDQKDSDSDSSGDVCDLDNDNDGVVDKIDNCPLVSNSQQKDLDKDGAGDACDPVDDRNDIDGDGIKNDIDNCPAISNPNQADIDGDGTGDACDSVDNRNDGDGDGVKNNIDNCPAISNPNQADLDNDGKGDACDSVDDRDDDGDGVRNSIDNCPSVANANQSDLDNNGKGDACDTTDVGDSDGDGVVNVIDNCPLVANADQADSDKDGKGDACDVVNDVDTDSDGVPDNRDEFPNDGTKISSVTSAYRLMTQATFGATEAEMDRIVSIGVDAWIDEELDKPSAYDSSFDSFKTHLERTIEITKQVAPYTDWNKDGAIFGTGSVPGSLVMNWQMSTWWENALGSPVNQSGSDQLRQRVTYALSQILVASAKDFRLSQRGETLAYYNDILAKNAFGNFRTLLGEVSRSATMGVYLTYQANKKANPVKSTRPDENYARELIQLFSVGLFELNIDGTPNRDGNANTYPDVGTAQIPTYTQDDVVELAKVMTGWDVKGNNYYGDVSMRRGEYAAQMVFHPDHHEDEIAEGGDGQVTVFGKTFALDGGADNSGLDPALDVIFAHTNVAPFISKNLIMNLVTSNPSSAYVARVANVFNDNGTGIKGDLKAVVKAILTDVEARDTSTQSEVFGKVKEPILIFTQLLRAFDVKPLDGWKGADTDGSKRYATVNGVYAWNAPEKDFGQAPLRSPSVFNFYMPDFVPSHSYFSDRRMVAPESQIGTDGNIVSTHNLIANYLRDGEKNEIVKIDNKTLASFASTKAYWNKHLMLINYDRELDVFEQALDGDTNGDFVNLNNDVDKERAVNALLTRLDKVMLGNTMTSEYRSKLYQYLMTATFISYGGSDFGKAHHMIKNAVRFIATSPAFMSQH